MREAAGEALMETDSINRERGIVLSEERTRAGPGLRAALDRMAFTMKDMLPAKRFPIGNVDIIQNAPRDRFVEFYEAYYRPDNAALVVVGDLDMDKMEAKIRDRFSNWRARGEAGKEPEMGKVVDRDLEVGIYTEAGLSPSITLSWVRAEEPKKDTLASRRDDIIASLALSAVNRRLARVRLQSDPPFLEAGAGSSIGFETQRESSFGASFANGDWQTALTALDEEHRRLMQFGISKSELERAVTDTRQSYMGAVASESTRSSAQLAKAALTGISAERVVTTPEDRLEFFNETVRNLTAVQA